MTANELKEFLDEKVDLYNRPDFIDSDPIQIPHQFTVKEDIEIAGFLAATLAWGNRKMIIKSSQKLMNLMGNAPFDFVMTHTETDLERLDGFVHRTFNATDARIFISDYQISKARKFDFLALGEGVLDDVKHGLDNLRGIFLDRKSVV